jgi:hypothetical protein
MGEQIIRAIHVLGSWPKSTSIKFQKFWNAPSGPQFQQFEVFNLLL